MPTKPLPPDAEDRRLKVEVHQAVGCRFTASELRRLSAIKSRRTWRPAHDRPGWSPASGFDPLSTRRDKSYLDILSTFLAITGLSMDDLRAGRSTPSKRSPPCPRR